MLFVFLKAGGFLRNSTIQRNCLWTISHFFGEK